jgi:RNA polymerase sigma factor (sigma-70 family)
MGMSTDDDARTFEEVRPRLMGLAYRILGSTADAADAVQDTYIAWQRADKQQIRSAPAWLTTVCTRRALDLATAADRARVSYVGPWLPEFVHTDVGGVAGTAADAADVGEQVALASSVTTAFLLLLERLTPRERAAYVLRELFDWDYGEVAAALDMQEPACRQLVARARRNIGRPNQRYRTPEARQQELLDAFHSALAGDSMDALASLLADDVALSADSGGKAPAPRQTLQGRDAVLRFFGRIVVPHTTGVELRDAEINATRGLEVLADGVMIAALTFDFDDDGRVRSIFAMRNPDKLARLSRAPISLN